MMCMKNDKVAVVYCRTASILEDGNDSLIEQSSQCIRKAIEDGYKKCECIIDIRSGLTKKRFVNQELKSLRRLVRSHKVDAVYLTSLCRLSRNSRTCSELLRYFKRYQVRVIICD